MTKLAKTPAPPYYAVIFSNEQTDDLAGYEAAAQRMLALAAEQPGYLGVESAREGLGITVSYWRDEDAIHSWKANLEHAQAQGDGRSRWYQRYITRVARVERDYGFER